MKPFPLSPTLAVVALVPLPLPPGDRERVRRTKSALNTKLDFGRHYDADHAPLVSDNGRLMGALFIGVAKQVRRPRGMPHAGTRDKEGGHGTLFLSS